MKDKLQIRRERELRRYRSVVNATGDVKLARQMRGRSESYIFATYGIKVPKKAPRLKEYTKETRYRKQLEVRRYRYAIERGVKPQEALKLKKRSFKYIEEKARYYTPVEPPKTVKAKPVELSRDARIKKWSSWSKKANKEGFPPYLKNKAQEINIKNGFDVNSKYGFTVMFYAYIENEPTSKWLKLIKADRVTEMAIYRTPMVLV
jgi:hypothetical protein